MLATRNALAFTSVLLDFHRVLRMLVLMRATRRPRASATRPRRPARRRGRGRPNPGGGIILGQHHHGVPTFSAGRHGERERKRDRERIRRCGGRRQGRKRGERERRGRSGGCRERVVYRGHHVGRRRGRGDVGVLFGLNGRREGAGFEGPGGGGRCWGRERSLDGSRW